MPQSTKYSSVIHVSSFIYSFFLLDLLGVNEFYKDFLQILFTHAKKIENDYHKYEDPNWKKRVALEFLMSTQNNIEGNLK